MTLNVSATDKVTIRELQPHEWSLLATKHPFDKIGVPDITHSRVVIGENESGEIVAYWVIFETVHVEPLWIDDAYRKRAGVLRRLWNSVIGILKETKTPFAFGIVKPDLLVNHEMADRLGFKELPGTLYYLVPEKAFQTKLDADLKLLESAPEEVEA